MSKDYKVDGKGVMQFLLSRKVVLENSNNETIIDMQLMLFLVAMLFLGSFIIVGLIISLFLGCKISIIDTSKVDFNKDNFK